MKFPMDEDKEVHCPDTGEMVTRYKCDIRRYKARLFSHNPKFVHNMTEKQLKVCGGCWERIKLKENVA